MIVKILKNKGKPSYGKIVNVYGFYCIDNELYVLVVLEGNPGLQVFMKEEVEFIDSSVGEDMVFVSDSPQVLFLHKKIVENNLYEDLMEGDENAHNYFIGLV